MPWTVGLDFGTNSARAVVVNCRDGSLAGKATCPYPSGEKGILLDPSDHELARQHPDDYLYGLENAVGEALLKARLNVPEFSPEAVIGIGVTATGSSPLPVDSENRALASQGRFKENLSAQCWLWKDHTSVEEATWITELVQKWNPEFLSYCGGVYSPEWWWAKIWHCQRVDREVFRAAASWVELSDWIPSILAGVDSPGRICRCAGCAGHKAMYDPRRGLPEREFFATLDPELVPLRDTLYERVYNAAESAGHLCIEWSRRLGLPEGIPVAIGGIDVYYGAIGAGVCEGTLVKIIGTSACDCTVVPGDRDLRPIPGICGSVMDSVLPGMYGLEAGQCAVGDIFAWWVDRICSGTSGLHRELEREASSLWPGQSGLLALDWQNGNRNILVDSRLTGLLLGQTLHTSRAEIYRALIEATAFGARMIRDRLRDYGIIIHEIVCAGGISSKNTLLMQIYSNVLDCPLLLSLSDETCALGASIAASVVAGSRRGGFPGFWEAQNHMAANKKTACYPDREQVFIYDRLFQQFRKLHDSFGNVSSEDLGSVMKNLLELKEEVCGHRPSAGFQESP